MKKSINILFVAAIMITGYYSKAFAQTASELLDKAIAFHDPQQKWNNYSGKVHLETIFSDGNAYGGEIIEIQTKEDYYKATGIANMTVKGIKNGVIFREVNGDKNPSEDVIKDKDIGDETIQRFKLWHYFHFGTFMELKASGMLLEDKVEAIKFQGNDCLALTFTYDASKVKNDFYNATWIFYLDPISSSLKGFKVVSKDWNRYVVFSGILDVNGIKIPQYRTYFNSEDNSFSFVDIFSNVQ